MYTALNAQQMMSGSASRQAHVARLHSSSTARTKQSFAVAANRRSSMACTAALPNSRQPVQSGFYIRNPLHLETNISHFQQNKAAAALMGTARPGWMLASVASIDLAEVSMDGVLSDGRAELEIYEAGLSTARSNFMATSGLDSFLNHLNTLERADAQRLLASMLLVFTAVGSRMTAPVQSWIYRAGEACIRLGFTAAGEELKKHAVGEAGHDKWYANDARAIAAFMKSELGVEGVDADQLMAQDIPEPVRQYIVLHENVIESDAPFCQLAIENEIELLSLLIGKPFMTSIMEYLGGDFNKQCMTFVARHVVADEDHCVENEEMLLELLAEHPEAAEQLVGVGRDSLQVYANHLRHCIREGYSLAGVQMP